MTREEFLERLNHEEKRRNLSITTDEILDDLLEAKIFEPRKKLGKISEWTESDWERGLKILDLKSQGLRIHGEIRFHLWVDDPDIPLLNSKFDAPGILSREFVPLGNKLFSRIRSNYPGKEKPAPDSFSAKCVVRKMGELDPCFGPWVEYTEGELLDAYTTLRFGDSDGHLDQVMSRLRSKISIQLAGIFKQTFPRVPSRAIRAAIAAIPCHVFSKIIRLFYLDEMNKAIFDATKSEYLLARRALYASVILFRCIGLQKVSDSLRHPAWQTPMFVLLLHMVRRAKGTPFELRPEVFDFMEKIPSFFAANSMT